MEIAPFKVYLSPYLPSLMSSDMWIRVMIRALIFDGDAAVMSLAVMSLADVVSGDVISGDVISGRR